MVIIRLHSSDFWRSRVGAGEMQRGERKSHHMRPIFLYVIFLFCYFHSRIDGERGVSATMGISGGLHPLLVSLLTSDGFSRSGYSTSEWLL
jgi:hypothetical protein